MARKLAKIAEAARLNKEGRPLPPLRATRSHPSILGCAKAHMCTRTRGRSRLAVCVSSPRVKVCKLASKKITEIQRTDPRCPGHA